MKHATRESNLFVQASNSIETNVVQNQIVTEISRNRFCLHVTSIRQNAEGARSGYVPRDRSAEIARLRDAFVPNG